jgi:hypothetical protein
MFRKPQRVRSLRSTYLFCLLFLLLSFALTAGALRPVNAQDDSDVPFVDTEWQWDDTNQIWYTYPPLTSPDSQIVDVYESAPGEWVYVDQYYDSDPVTSPTVSSDPITADSVSYLNGGPQPEWGWCCCWCVHTVKRKLHSSYDFSMYAAGDASNRLDGASTR